MGVYLGGRTKGPFIVVDERHGFQARAAITAIELKSEIHQHGCINAVAEFAHLIVAEAQFRPTQPYAGHRSSLSDRDHIGHRRDARPLQTGQYEISHFCPPVVA